ncbi:pyrimidine 5'-nucleotidase [Vibrio sp. SM6]|uniref:Pyrimidine 5'-nucleotidase n=1 Tax=Vibrio agarilyticus TaxID=2726741 RepID=A0A7X8TNP2_9VIBR|nr:pyrimidine 5'-nucleotidase [Vibrio agarilyticus]
MQYEWILFDADETLFHFDGYQGLRLMFSRYGVDFDEQAFAQYQQINKPLWVEYQNGTITADELKQTRFQSWAQKLDTTTQALNTAFLQAMADISTPLPGARELLNALQGRAKLGIITNGFTELQAVRLSRNEMSDTFEHVVVSEEVGVAKPDAKIFAYTSALMAHPDPKKVLMVGDTLQSDILGGARAGFDTCWLNRHDAPSDPDIQPTFTVSSLEQLQALLFAA